MAAMVVMEVMAVMAVMVVIEVMAVTAVMVVMGSDWAQEVNQTYENKSINQSNLGTGGQSVHTEYHSSS